MSPRLHLFRLTLAGLPELEKFPNDEARSDALVLTQYEIDSSTGAWGRRGCLAYFTIAGLAIATYVLAIRPGLMSLFPTWVPSWGDTVFHGVIGLALFGVFVRWVHRRAAQPVLRRELIRLGLPICNGCGYDLRGRMKDPVQCPECGRVIEIEIRLLLTDRLPNDMNTLHSDS